MKQLHKKGPEEDHYKKEGHERKTKTAPESKKTKLSSTKIEQSCKGEKRTSIEKTSRKISPEESL